MKIAAWTKAYYAKHKAKITARKRASYAKHKTEIAARKKAYCAKHKAKIAAQGRAACAQQPRLTPVRDFQHLGLTNYPASVAITEHRNRWRNGSSKTRLAQKPGVTTRHVTVKSPTPPPDTVGKVWPHKEILNPLAVRLLPLVAASQSPGQCKCQS